MLNKQLILLILMVNFCLLSLAQPTLTSSSFNQNVGETFDVLDISFSSVSPGSSGANQTWDFSNGIELQSFSATMLDPASTPYGSSFPSANICQESGGSYAYYRHDNNAQQIHGTFQSGVIIQYNNPEDYIRFPLNYTDSFTDYFEANYESGGVNFYRSGTSTGTYDGYGTLIMPYGTFSNVIRVKLVEDYQDSSVLGITLYDAENHYFILPGTHVSLVTLNDFYWNGAPSAQIARFLDSTSIVAVSGITQIDDIQLDVNIFPNPAAQFSQVVYALKHHSNVNVELYNATGQMLEVISNGNKSPGIYQDWIDLSTRPPGLYILRIQVDGLVTAQKLQVIR